MPNLQNFLEHSDLADLLHRGLQGLYCKLNACALWRKSIPVVQDILVMDLELRLPAWILIPNNGKRLSSKRTRKKKSVQPERIGFHSVATVWFSFHWLIWLLRKKSFNIVDNSAGSMILSATMECFSPSSTLKSDVNGWFILKLVIKLSVKSQFNL